MPRAGAVLCQRRQMRDRQFPLAAGAVLGALGEYLGGEHAIDLEELEFHRVAARIRRGVDEGARAGEVTAVIRRRFGDENRLGQRGSPCLTVSKGGMAKRRLTMSTATQPFFVVSSGRSGTAMLHKALSASDNMEMHHEYAVQIAQPLAVKRYLGLIDSAEATRVLDETHAASIRCSEAAHWGVIRPTSCPG